MTTADLMVKIAEQFFPHGAVITCPYCGKSVEETMLGAACYLRIGWPRCCGNIVEVRPKLAPIETAEASKP